MFKVPDWEDTPTSTISFKKELPKKNKQKTKKAKTPVPLKQVVQAKSKFKAKNKINSKLRLVTGVQKPSKKQKVQKIKAAETQKQEKLNFTKKEMTNHDLADNMKDSDYGIKIKNYDTDKLDEMILDVKKQRLDTYKNDDNEEILFKESAVLYSEGPKRKVAKNNRNNINSNKTIKNIITKNTEESKQELCSPPVDEKQIKSIDKVNNNHNIDHGIDNEVIDKNVNLKIRKKEILKSILQVNSEGSRNHINVNGNKLRERMLDRLKAAKFRYLNEKLYTSSGSDAQQLFQGDPGAFSTYHEGYRQQLDKWPVKPLDVIVKRIQKMPKTHVIADMGCGTAELSRRVPQAVRAFDLVAAAPGVTACDMARTPLPPASVDAAVYCLALMGTDLTRYLLEANRVLKLGGYLLIAEVESRFDNLDAFTSGVQRLGFSLKKADDSHQVFVFLEFTKVHDPPAKKGKLPTLTLKPCVYKKR